jgi:hypothetical protein
LPDVYSLIQHDQQLIVTLLNLRRQMRLASTRSRLFFAQAALSLVDKDIIIDKYNEYMKDATDRMTPLFMASLRILDLCHRWQLRVAPSTVQRALRRAGLATRRQRLTVLPAGRSASATPERSHGTRGRTGSSSGCKARSCRSIGAWPSVGATSRVERRSNEASMGSCSPTITSGPIKATGSVAAPPPRSSGAPLGPDRMSHSALANAQTGPC